MRRKDWPTDPAEIRRSIDEAIQDLVRKGLVVDSGQRIGQNGQAAMKPCGSLRSSARRSTERGIRKTTSLTRTPPDRVAQTSGPASSTCHGIGVPSAEADDTTATGIETR
jgi:hypothetical protein